MSWSSGSVMFSAIVEAMKENVEDSEIREAIYNILIDVFEDYDCDTLDECVGSDYAFDNAYESRYPSEGEEVEEVEDGLKEL